MVELSLTRWQMAIREDDGDLAVQIAAEDDVGGLAVTADFILDAITRVACFGALVETLIQPFVYRETPAFCTTLDGLLLENAMLGMVDRAYGVGREGWVSVGESRWDPVLVITPVVLPGGRNDLGFVSSFENHIWPRLWVHGLSMAAIAGYLSYGWSFHQVWSGRPGVKLEEREYKYGVSELAEALTLDGNLSKAGLSLTFTVETKVGSHWRPKGGPLVRDCLLPWELLILRFPEFTSHLPHFRKQGEAGAS
ncbi:hypothetical protein DKG75_05120 [Zavarzinia compransoris]|uniref:Uncharacterized protein n=2 Tax=Zavarzinia compransoris TaxID=1264899 RepID=A0A317EEY2_9PROT|nr:hypothetical protein DKG75_05120 [Zavarzinia compransoris]